MVLLLVEIAIGPDPAPGWLVSLSKRMGGDSVSVCPPAPPEGGAQAEGAGVYPAYVPSIFSRSYGSILSLHGFIFGSNEKPSDASCGAIYRKIQCVDNELHNPSYRHNRCNDPGCPVCYVKFSSRMADRVTERVQGFKTVYRDSKPYHVIFWGKPMEGRPYAGLTEAFRCAKVMLSNMGVQAACVWYHPYRIRKDIKPILRQYKIRNGLNGRVGFWKLAHDDVLNIGGLENYIEPGPHFHAIATGYLRDSKEYAADTGCGYKKKRYLMQEIEVHTVAHYISTHACREAGKSSVRYYGNLSYRMLAREMVKEEIKDLRCDICGARLNEFDSDDTGVALNKLKDRITEKVKYYLYWKKGQPKPDMRDNVQCLITRFTGNALF